MKTALLVLPGFSSEKSKYSRRIEEFRSPAIEPILPELSYWKKPVVIREGLGELLGRAEGAIPKGRKFIIFASSFGVIIGAGILSGARGKDCVGAVFWNPSVAPKESPFWSKRGEWEKTEGGLFRNIHPPTGEEAVVSEKFLEETLLWDSSVLAGKIRCPFLILQGKEDRAVSIPAVRGFFGKLASERKEIVFLDSGHGWRNPLTGEKLPEIEKEAMKRTFEFFRGLA